MLKDNQALERCDFGSVCSVLLRQWNTIADTFIYN